MSPSAPKGVHLNQVQGQRVTRQSPSGVGCSSESDITTVPMQGAGGGAEEGSLVSASSSPDASPLVLCPMEMQKGLTRPFWMRVPIPRGAAWEDCSHAVLRGRVTFRVFKGWASRQSVGLTLALPRSSPAMHFLQVQRNQEACSFAQRHAMTWDGGAETGECRRTGHFFPPVALPTHLWLMGGGRLSVARPGIWPAPAGFGLRGCEHFRPPLIPCTRRWHACSRERLLVLGIEELEGLCHFVLGTVV